MIGGAVALALGACGGGQAKTPDALAGEAFLRKNARADGVKTLKDGLQYRIVSSGPADGPHPKLGDDVRVNYEGSLIDGTVFDTTYKDNEPAVFTVGGVIPAWNEALQLMRPGDVWYLYVPPALGYGSRSAGPIPPNSVMVFKIELLSVLPHAGAGSGAAQA